MKRWASSLIALMLLFSLAFVGVSLAQARDPYFTPPNNPPIYPPVTTPTNDPSPTPSSTVSPSPGCSIDPDVNGRGLDCPGPGPTTPGPGPDDDVDGGGTGKDDDDVLGDGLGKDLPQERGPTVPDAAAPLAALPFTGAQLMLFLVLGIAATGTGLALVRRSRTP